MGDKEIAAQPPSISIRGRDNKSHVLTVTEFITQLRNDIETKIQS